MKYILSFLHWEYNKYLKDNIYESKTEYNVE